MIYKGMPIEDRVRIIMATEAAEASNPGRRFEYMESFITFHIQDAIREYREAIARMVATWNGEGGHIPVFDDIAQAIREGKTCVHKWTDMRNKIIQSGEICLKCGTVRAGNEATDVGEAPTWKFKPLNHGQNPG